MTFLILFLSLKSPDITILLVERRWRTASSGVRRQKVKTKGNVSMVEGEPVFCLITSHVGHSRRLVNVMVKMRRAIRALERPAERREDGAEGERMDNGWLL
jgi:hypothetical protein